jgi:nucleotide-binding universal stress UspA family protein
VSPDPVVIAFDGSAAARAAMRHAADLFPGRQAIVATVWEPGLATMSAVPADSMGRVGYLPDPETVKLVDDAEQGHATRVAQQGAELARSLGLPAEPHVVADDLDVGDTLIALADDRNAAGIVVGSHGISGLRSHLVGSVARKLIQHSGRPVVVVRADAE